MRCRQAVLALCCLAFRLPALAHIRETTMLRMRDTAFAIVLATLMTVPAKAVDLDRLTVVTLTRDGSWGVATAGSQGQAIAAAIRACRAMAATPSDCGAQSVTTRGGWVVASECGEHKTIVAAETREAAERAAVSRELDLKRLYEPNVPRCRRVLTVGPAPAPESVLIP